MQGHGQAAEFFAGDALALNNNPEAAETLGMSAVGTVQRADSFGPDFPNVLAAAQAGGAWALRVLYDGLSPAVLGYARTQGVADPDGLVNDVFFRAFRRIGTFDGDAAALRSWVFTIAHNAIVDERRRSSRRVVETGPPADDIGAAVPSAEDGAFDVLSEARVRQVLAQLPADQCEVLTLRLVADLTIVQVAEVLGRSVGATKALQRRGLNRLRKMLDGGVPL